MTRFTAYDHLGNRLGECKTFGEVRRMTLHALPEILKPCYAGVELTDFDGENCYPAYYLHDFPEDVERYRKEQGVCIGAAAMAVTKQRAAS